MRKSLIPLLAAVALPNAFNAENWYLFSRAGNVPFFSPMDSEEICEKAGQKFINQKSWTGDKAQWGKFTYLCVKSK